MYPALTLDGLLYEINKKGVGALTYNGQILPVIYTICSSLPIEVIIRKYATDHSS